MLAYTVLTATKRSSETAIRDTLIVLCPSWGKGLLVPYKHPSAVWEQPCSIYFTRITMALSRRAAHSLCSPSLPFSPWLNICFMRRLHWGNAFWMLKHILGFSGGDMDFRLSFMLLFCSLYSETPGSFLFFFHQGFTVLKHSGVGNPTDKWASERRWTMVRPNPMTSTETISVCCKYVFLNTPKSQRCSSPRPDIRFVKSQTVTEKQTQSRLPADSYLGTGLFLLTE